MSDEMHPSDQQPATKADLASLAASLATKADLNATNAGLSATTAGLSALKTEFRSFSDELRTDFRAFTTEMRELLRPIQINVARHEGALSGIREELKGMRETMVTRDEFHSRMDGFVRLVDDHNWSAAKNRVRLDDHEKRINALEEKRPQ
ncbi:MAG: hypothetical protein HY923_01095 [Elusimicrobia bacterium]|nr:hypothetical protein [Elusimicrobiota bacterium]